MKKLLATLPALITLVLILPVFAADETEHKKQSLEEKVEALLAQMTIEEKVGQLNQLDWSAVSPRMKRDGALKDQLTHGMIGSFLNATGARQIRELQEVAVENSRLGIPIIFGLDVIHGYKTVFPVPLAEAASWDLKAIEKSARIAATEAASAGINWTFAPMVDIARDARWGRIMEGAGEDPYLGSVIAAARVRGFQGENLASTDTILACAKHYAAYGAAEAGREYNTVDMSLVRLWNVYLPPFKAAVDAGVGSVMLGFHELNGIPTSAHNYLVTDVLKGKWAFAGFTVSDYGSFYELVNHGYVEDRIRAAQLAFNAGGDMDMHSKCFMANIEDLVKKGLVSNQRLDDAVRRILTAKFALGLFDDPYKYCDDKREEKLLLHPDHIQAALDVARKTIVLLKNEGSLLPLPKDVNNVAVIGMLADSKVDMLGNWAAQGDRDTPVTLLAALKDRLSDKTNILYSAGYEQYGKANPQQIAQAVETAKKADVVILAVGENANMSGECTSRADIGLPHEQPTLVAEIARLNIPTVAVLFNGRPLTIKQLHDSCPAILECWLLGTQAGPAIVDCLFGDYNPSGRLPVTFPLAVGQVPIFYSQKNTGRPLPPGSSEWGKSKYSDVPNDPLYPFGFGLSYTTFDYSDIRLNKNKIKSNEPLTVSVAVTNTGNRRGRETVQLYIRDLVATITRPVKELKKFELVTLEPGQQKEITFTLTSADLSFYDEKGQLKCEPGRFDVFAGPNSRDLKEAAFQLE